MKELTVERDADGNLDIRYVPPALAFAIRELPKLLSEEFPESTSRLRQDPYSGTDEDDTEDSEEWARHGQPELRHLFDTAKEIVLRDIAGMKLDGILPPLYRLAVPATNITAWLSALAAARVGLGEVHEVTPEDLERVGGSLLPNERDRGILLIQLLGWLQAVLLGEDEA
jgi:hypothetical protein